MAYISLALPLYVLCRLVSVGCYTYQSKPLFMSFSDLAALEANSLDQTDGLNSHPAGDLGASPEPVRERVLGEHAVETVVVRCHEDTIEVVMEADLFRHGLPVEPEHLRLGPIRASGDLLCKAQVSGHGEYTIVAPLSMCGTKLKVTEDSVVFSNLLVYTPPPASPGDVFRTEGVAVLILCKYKRRYSVSTGALRPTWSPLLSTRSTLLRLEFRLKLMTNDWEDERQSSVYFLGDMINIEASVDVANQLPPLRLYVNTCVATLTPDVRSQPRYPFIDREGCFTDALLTRSSSRFLPRRQDSLLQMQLQPFLFHQENGHAVGPFRVCDARQQDLYNMLPGSIAHIQDGPSEKGLFFYQWEMELGGR